MLLVASLIIVSATGLFLTTLGVIALIFPALAARFFMSFATSLKTHFAELVIRLLIAVAFLVAAPHLPFSALLRSVGWVLMLTTVGLLLVPWRLHNQFARRAVPRAMHFLPLIGAASLSGGIMLLGAVVLAKVTHA